MLKIETLNINQKGILMALAGIVFISPDALFIRLVNGGPEPVIFWKSFFSFLILLLIICIKERKNTIRLIISQGIPGLVMGIIFAFGNIMFTSAIKYTVASNVLVTFSISPIITAILTAVFLKEKVHKSTWVVMFFCIMGVTVFFIESMSGTGLKGIIFALFAALSVSCEMVLIRRYSNLSVFACLMFAALIASVLYWPFRYDITGSTDLWILFINAAMLSMSFFLLFNSSKLIAPTWTNMIMLVEVVTGTYLVWLFLDESMSSISFLGALIILVPLVVYFTFQFKTGEVR